MTRFRIITLAVIAVLGASGVAYASTESAQVSFAPGTFQINPQTCVFTHREVDQPLGSTWTVGKVAFAYEDERHDVALGCLRRLVSQDKAPAPDTCWTTPPIVAEAKPDKQGYHDTTGARALSLWAVALAKCEEAR